METFTALLAICVTGELPTQRPVTRSFDVTFDLGLNKRLSKQWRRSDLIRHGAHYDVIVIWYNLVLQLITCHTHDVPIFPPPPKKKKQKKHPFFSMGGGGGVHLSIPTLHKKANSTVFIVS